MRRLLTGSAGALLLLCSAACSSGSDGGGDGGQSGAAQCADLIGKPVGTSSDGQDLDDFPGCSVNGLTFTGPSSSGCYKAGQYTGQYFWIGDVMAGAAGGTWQKLEKGATMTEMSALVGCS